MSLCSAEYVDSMRRLSDSTWERSISGGFILNILPVKRYNGKFYRFLKPAYITDPRETTDPSM